MAGKTPLIHPLIVRVTHWINAFAILLMVMSGWRIYNAAPFFPFRFPPEITLGGWLAGALQWHFAAMWLFAGNLLIYLAFGIFSGRFRMKLFPVTPRAILTDIGAFFRGKLGHADLSMYNAVQKIFYIVAILAMIVLIASGIAIWKPVQMQEIASLMGGYEGARRVHFFAMATVVGFVAVHVVMALLVPKSLLAMVRGR
ncbi:cytochrome b561 [Terrihabitans soli]|uniref:Cytochrome b561 n=1 Tax=Terrihabitans soli TaxID=708113 RepID=A0A6S6QRF2_9HYPH|nr:cytochrome b/b6 domain-containing protein [Terrihabitans soli]BCJ89460.1 cytochrome b561 [Terrihabitans soli]